MCSYLFVKEFKVLMHYVFIGVFCFETAFTLVLGFLNHISHWCKLIASDHRTESETSALNEISAR